jgi:hypothetical protein
VALLGLDLGLNHSDGVGGLYIDGIGVSREGFLRDELHGRGERHLMHRGGLSVPRALRGVIPRAALVLRLVVIGIEALTLQPGSVTLAHPVAVVVHIARGAELTGLHRLRGVVGRATVFRKAMQRIITYAELTSRVASSLP